MSQSRTVPASKQPSSRPAFHPSRRQSAILSTVRLQGSCGIAELARALDVSEESIRRDVKTLAMHDLVQRVHGGVVSPDQLREPPFLRRMEASKEDKQRIAALTASRIADGDSLMLDTGTTTSYVARALMGHSNLTVVTNSVEIARTLAPRNGNRVFMAGGELRSDDGASLGAAAITFIDQFTVGHAILSIGAISADQGLVDFHLSEAEFSRAVIRRANHVTVVADAKKFGRSGFVSVCGFDAVDTLITSAPPQEPFNEQLAQAGVEVLVA